MAAVAPVPTNWVVAEAELGRAYHEKDVPPRYVVGSRHAVHMQDEQDIWLAHEFPPEAVHPEVVLVQPGDPKPRVAVDPHAQPLTVLQYWFAAEMRVWVTVPYVKLNV